METVHERVVMARMMRALRATVLFKHGLSEHELALYAKAKVVVASILACGIMLLVGSCVNAHADSIPENKAVLAIIGEAENQGAQGMLAVACGISNRGTLKGVYGLNAPRVKAGKYSKTTYDLALSSWRHVMQSDDTCNFLGGATMWENIDAFGKPSWYNNVIETYRYKNHIFFKEKKRKTNGKIKR